MRKTCLDMVYELAKKDPRIFFIGSDLGVGTLKQFKAEMPDRFLMEGVSEANVVGMAAGLALEGKIVYVNTIATFLTRRCFEQVALDPGEVLQPVGRIVQRNVHVFELRPPPCVPPSGPVAIGAGEWRLGRCR